MYYEMEDYVPLNWDKLSSDPDVWMTIKEEMDKKFGADCMMKIITKAKEVGLKDKDIFLPVEEEKEEYVDAPGNYMEDQEEYEDPFENSIDDTTEDK